MMVAAIIKKPMLVSKMAITGAMKVHMKDVLGFRKHLQNGRDRKCVCS